MKLSEYRETYYEFSDKASSIARQLTFAGIAIVWLFRVETDSGPRIPESLLFVTFLFVLVLALDFLQYVSGAAIWGIFQWVRERNLQDVLEDPDISAPAWFKRPQLFFFVCKLALLVVTLVVLALFVLRQWRGF